MNLRTAAIVAGLASLMLLSCRTAPDASALLATSEVLAANTSHATASGASFIAPAGWTLATQGAVTRLAPPEAEGSQLLLVEVAATNANLAVKEAWLAAGIAPRWPLATGVNTATADGWEQRWDFSYEVPAIEGRDLTARALQHGRRWTVLLTDFSTALRDKRASQVNLVTGRLLAPGYQRESFAGRPARTLDAARLAELDALLREGMTLYGVPALSFGIVQDGRVVFAGGIGPREVGRPALVDAQTNFIIASNTKQLTTLLLAKLVDAGRFTWDTPVEQLLPGFALGDAATTRQVLVRHLVCACTGLPRQDKEWLFEYQDATAASTLRQLAAMQPTSGFGALYQYSNPLASAAGYVGAHVAHPELELGAAYDRAMQELVFNPLGMRHTTFDFGQALAGNFAVPYGADPDGRTAPANLVSNYSIHPLRPAGGAWSNVEDLLRYVQMELDAGLLPDGQRYISRAALMARREPQIAMNADVTYGMGLRVDRSWGIPVVRHGGAMNGYKSDVFWLPEHNVGAVVLTSSEEGDNLLGPFRRRLVELLFDGKPSARADLAANASAWRTRHAAERARLQLPADATASSMLATHYRNAGMGPITVRREGAETVFDFGEWHSTMASRRNEDGSIGFVTTSPGMAGHQFVVLPEAEGRRRLVTRSEQQEYVFVETN